MGKDSSNGVVASTLGASFGRNRGLGQENEIDTLVCGALSAAHGGPDDNSGQAGHIIVGALGGTPPGGGWRIGIDEVAVNQAVPTAFGVRRLTPRECERLQGFPDDWTAYGVDGSQADSARYRQLGNAVCVSVSAWLGRQIVKVLS